jgi:hypothetical protein
MEELFEVAKQIEEIKIALERAKGGIYVEDPNVSKILDDAFQAQSIMDKLLDKLEDLEMGQLKIDVDKYFEGNPISEYVQAGIDYISGDETAIGRMTDAYNKWNEEQKGENEKMKYTYLEPAQALEALKLFDEDYYNAVNEALEGIEKHFEGTIIDGWTDDEVELARYFLSHNSSTSHFEVGMLSPHGVKVAWKRRRYMGAAK